MTTAEITVDIDHPPFDLEKIRKDFPILDQQVNDKPLVYLDNAASSQKPVQVIEAIDDYYKHHHSNVHRGIHTLSQRATELYENGREKIRKLLNADSTKEIIFVRGATEGINLVANSYGAKFLKEGDEILVTTMEHHANIVPWQLVAERVGAKVVPVPIDDNGDVLMEEFDRLLTDKVKFVSIVHVSNALGTINPVKEMIDKAHAKGAHVLIDGCQALPHMRVDVKALGAEFYTFSAHKVFGPTGIGILYGKEELLEQLPPYQGEIGRAHV